MSLLLDLALGFALLFWLHRKNHIGQLADALVPVAEVSDGPEAAPQLGPLAHSLV